MTPLDQAFEAAKTNESKRNDFYALVLNSTLYIPTHDIPAEEKFVRADDNSTFNPIIVEAEGTAYVMLFDTIEKLTNWAQRPVGYVGLPGHVIASISESHLHWALNAGTNYLKIFMPDEVRWMKEAFLGNKNEFVNISAGTQVMIGEPATIPAGLIEQLTQTITTRNPEISAAYLAQVLYQRDGEEPHLVLVLRVDSPEKSLINAIQKDLGMAARGCLDEGTYLDICIDDGTNIANEITKMVAPFYTK